MANPQYHVAPFHAGADTSHRPPLPVSTVDAPITRCARAHPVVACERSGGGPQRERIFALPSPRGLYRAATAAWLAAAAMLIVTVPARAGVLGPESGGSPNANSIEGLYRVTFVIAAVIFFAVTGTLVVFLVRYRARRGRVAEQVRGNTRLEIAWTAAAGLILVVLAVLTFAKLHGIVTPARSGPAATAEVLASVDEPPPPGGRALHIRVTGRQFLWRFDYPNGAYSYEQLEVPSGVTVVLDVHSIDVNHSWWVPKLGGKVDAVPGYVNHTWFKITRPGVFDGQCAELCGQEHARMIATVDAAPPASYETWVARQKQLIGQSQALRALQEREMGTRP